MASPPLGGASILPHAGPSRSIRRGLCTHGEAERPAEESRPRHRRRRQASFVAGFFALFIFLPTFVFRFAEPEAFPSAAQAASHGP